MPSKINVKVGCDILLLSRIRELMSQPDILKRVFHPSELKKIEPEQLAGIFAVKEATFKALEQKSPSWLQVEITHNNTGKPVLKLSKELNISKIISTDCSISHDGDYIFAVVTILQEE